MKRGDVAIRIGSHLRPREESTGQAGSPWVLLPYLHQYLSSSYCVRSWMMSMHSLSLSLPLSQSPCTWTSRGRRREPAESNSKFPDRHASDFTLDLETFDGPWRGNQYYVLSILIGRVRRPLAAATLSRPENLAKYKYCPHRPQGKPLIILTLFFCSKSVSNVKIYVIATTDGLKAAALVTDSLS